MQLIEIIRCTATASTAAIEESLAVLEQCLNKMLVRICSEIACGGAMTSLDLDLMPTLRLQPHRQAHQHYDFAH